MKSSAEFMNIPRALVLPSFNDGPWILAVTLACRLAATGSSHFLSWITAYHLLRKD